MVLKLWLARVGCVEVAVLLYLFISNSICIAQIVPDATLPINSVVENGVDNTKIINGGTIGGSNLFHSFDQFTIPAGGSAYFNNATNIQNIFSRVTGNSISNIDGVLRANGNANLFLLNHNGIIFGPNASLNIGGSFLATTARSIAFSDGTQFSTKLPQTTPLLTISVPIGLNIDSSSGKIYVQSNGHSLVGQNFRPVTGTNQLTGLRVQPGNNISLVGGDVVLEGGTLTAPSGRIEIGSVDTGTVNLNNSNLNLDYSQIVNFKDIELFTRSLLDTSGIGNGSIQLQGNNINLADGSVIMIQNQGPLSSGEIGLNATNSIKLSGTDSIARIPGSIRTETLTSGNSGNIVISTPKLTVTEGGVISTTTYSTGEAGNIIVKAPDSVQILGSSPRSSVTLSSINSISFSSGSAGDIQVQTANFTAEDGGLLVSTTNGRGNGGNIQIDATESVKLLRTQFNTLAPSAISSSTSGTGNAGNVVVNTKKVLLENGGRIDSSTVASGKAGNIAINASDSVEVKGTVPNSRNPSLIISSGNILDEALRISFGLPNKLTLTGDSGDVKITTSKLAITDGGLISVNNDGSGKGGALSVFADSIGLKNKSGITAATTSGQGGTVFLQAKNLQLNNSDVTATVNGGSNSGGNITINTNTLVALANSNIIAKAFEGNGGNIQISTQGLFLSPDSEISTSSRFGVDGVVNIQTLGFEVKNSLASLQDNFVTLEQVVAGSCLARRNMTQSSFVVTGSGALPTDPDYDNQEWESLSKPTSISSERSQSISLDTSAKKAWKLGDPIVEAQGIVRLPNGRVLLGEKSRQPSSPESLTCKTKMD